MKLIENSCGYTINNEGDVFSPSGDKLELKSNPGNPRFYHIKMKKGWRYVSWVKLMREYNPYEWIKELDDDEEVKPIRGTKYNFVTNKGRVWSSFWWKWLSPYFSKHPPFYYWMINYDRTSTYIHTLVGRYFLPEYRDGLLILHRDETLPFPEICYVDNLKVGTYTDNNRDTVLKGRNGYNPNRDEFGRFS